MNLESIVNIIASIVTCITAIISLIIAIAALFQANNQIKISNKQNLFNGRLKIYLLFNGLMELYNSNKGFIEEDKEDEIFFSSDFILSMLTNNSYLEIMSKVINKPLCQEEQKIFLSKIEELKNEAEKTKFIFNEETSNYLFDFIIAYEEVLMSLYKYCVLIDSMRRIQEEIPIKKDIHEVAKDVNEFKYRMILFDKFNNLSNAYNNVEKYKIREKLKDQIVL